MSALLGFVMKSQRPVVKNIYLRVKSRNSLSGVSELFCLLAGTRSPRLV